VGAAVKLDPRGPVTIGYVLALGRLVGAEVRHSSLLPRFSVYRLVVHDQAPFTVVVGTNDSGLDGVPGGALPVWIPRRA
jgi:hypothetical protein